PVGGYRRDVEPLPDPPADRGAGSSTSAARRRAGFRVDQPVTPRLPEGNAARTLVVLNPTAGQSEPDRVRRQIGGAFAVRGAPFEIVETTCGGDAERLAREAVRAGYRAVVAAGGDGTVAEV